MTSNTATDESIVLIVPIVMKPWRERAMGVGF
jgi:hypothetical protein